MLLGWASEARAIDRGSYSMEILVKGVPLTEYDARGKNYIEAIPHQEYAVRLTNRTGERVAVALSLDGLNSIDAKATSAQESSKWILAPYETVTIDGWQTSNQTARRFFFTTEEKSYGAWLGKTKNLGVVAAAFFRERRPPTVSRSFSSLWGGDSRDSERKDESARPEAGGRAAAENAPAPSSAEPQRQNAQKKSKLSEENAATGIGREVDHEVTRVAFEAESSPAAVTELRYEYHEALVRLGVLPRPFHPADPLDRREQARGFSDSGFAPDPYRSGGR